MELTRRRFCEVERKVFSFEGNHGGKWISITERSQGVVFSVAFSKEKITWFLEQLKKAVKLGSSLGFIRKFTGKSRTHLLEVCFNSRGRFLQLMEFITNQWTFSLVLPKGIKRRGWNILRSEISLMVESLSNDFLFELLEVLPIEKLEGSDQYGFKRSFSSAVPEEGPRKDVQTFQ